MDQNKEDSAKQNFPAPRQPLPQQMDDMSGPGRTNPQMFIPNSATMTLSSSSNYIPFFSDGSHWRDSSYPSESVHPFMLSPYANSNFCHPTLSQSSMDHQRFSADMVSQYDSQGGGLRLYDHYPTYGSSARMEPYDFTHSNSVNSSEVRQDNDEEENLQTKRDNSEIFDFPRLGGSINFCEVPTTRQTGYGQVPQTFSIYTNEWDFLSDSVPSSEICSSQRQEISTIMNYKHLQSEESVNLTIPHEVLMAEKRQCERMKEVVFCDPVTHVYNPLVYAFEVHVDFVRKYCCSEKPVLFLGMNPGPFGMVQNGVPFGEIQAVREWLKVEGEIFKPKHEHPKRPILGWSTTRSEISGKRFWGLFQRLCGQPENFFCHCFIHNYCPLAFLSASGKNVTQPELPLETRKELNNICDESLLDILRILNVKVIICLGRFVESRVKKVLKNNNLSEIRVETLSHPSPLNRTAHSGWEAIAMQQLKDMDVTKYLNNSSNEIS